MASTDGRYFPALDHLRAMAAFMVFGWHFTHVNSGQLAPPGALGLSFITEGHTGVALFMTLSGYLFAKLTDGKRLEPLPFFRNRALRLFPLLFLVMLLAGLHRVWAGEPLESYLLSLLTGFVLPTWPNGGWSIAVELHFYVLLPGLLWLSRRTPSRLLVVVGAAFALRLWLYVEHGHVHELAYATLLGRIDQFVLGMLAWQLRSVWPLTGWRLLMGLLAFAGAFHWFDRLGGFYGQGGFPSASPAWLGLCTLEGLAYASLIRWYDQRATNRSPGLMSRAIAQIGQWAYGIYLLHYFFVFDLARWIDQHLIRLESPEKAAVMALPAFLLMLPLAALTHRFIELPCMRLRRRY